MTVGADDGAIRLVVRGDDMAMCHAVNRGVVRAFTDGILTQTTTMVPCPWFSEGVGLLGEFAIPSGIHATLSSEFDNLRWRPLTGAPSLRRSDDGTFFRTPNRVLERANAQDVIDELTAQTEMFRSAGLVPTHIDPHMAIVVPGTIPSLCANLGIAFLHSRESTPDVRFDSVFTLSHEEIDAKHGIFLQWLDALRPGTHLVITHPAEPGDELASITRAGAHNQRWAEPIRASDLAVLTSADTRRAVERRGVELSYVTSAGTVAAAKK